MSSKTKTTATKEEATPALVPKLRFPVFRDAAGWERKEVGDVFQVTRGNVLSMTLVHDEKIEAMQYPVYSSQTKNNGLSGFYSKYLFADAITWTTDGANAGDVNYRAGKFFCTNVCGVLLSSKGFANPCIAALINSVARKYVSYVGNPKLMNGVMSKIPIPLPPLPEQQKIAECLSSVDELIAAQARKVDALKTHKKGLMQQLFPREGETQPHLRFPEFQNAGKWEEDTLDDIATFRRGSFPQPYGLPEWYDEKNGMPFIQVFDVGDSFRLKDKTKSKISKLGAEKSVFIPEGTLIVTLQGSIGRVAITHYDAYIDRTLLIFESFQKPIEKVFFSRVIQNLFDIEKEKAPGGIIKTITKESLSDFKVKYPTIGEQQRIADCLTTLDDLIAAQTQKHEVLKTHKKALMQQLFPSPE
jgi:restriction endonuclease S subunit